MRVKTRWLNKYAAERERELERTCCSPPLACVCVVCHLFAALFCFVYSLHIQGMPALCSTNNSRQDLYSLVLLYIT